MTSTTIHLFLSPAPHGVMCGSWGSMKFDSVEKPVLRALLQLGGKFSTAQTEDYGTTAVHSIPLPWGMDDELAVVDGQLIMLSLPGKKTGKAR